jgi:hypothetical protein
MSSNTISTDRLVTDLKRVVRDSEELIQNSAGAVGEKALEYLKQHAPHWLSRLTRSRGDKTERLFWQSGGGYDRNILDAGKSGFDSEIWGDVDQLMQAFRRTAYSSAVFRLTDAGSFDAVKARLESDPRLTVAGPGDCRCPCRGWCRSRRRQSCHQLRG